MYKTITFPIEIEDKSNYLQLMEKCSKMFNEYVDWAFDNKNYSKSDVHNTLYFKTREKYPEIPSALIQSTRDVALEAVKRSKFKTERPRKKTYSAIRYDKRSMTLSGTYLTFCNIGKRVKINLHVPDFFKPVFNTWNFKGGVICYNSKTKQFYAKLSFEMEDPPKCDDPEVIGIDRGIYNIVTLSNGTILNAKQYKQLKRKYFYNRRMIAAKVTPSAKRKLKKLSQKEKRLSTDQNHCISKFIANQKCGTFVVEDLTHIRKQVKTNSKRANHMLNTWSFSQLEFFLTYKATALGKSVVKIDPRYTSQKCSCCGDINKSNRYKSHYKCNTCGFTCHADLNAAINIRDAYLRTLSITKKSIEQAVVNQPTVSTSNKVIVRYKP